MLDWKQDGRLPHISLHRTLYWKLTGSSESPKKSAWLKAVGHNAEFLEDKRDNVEPDGNGEGCSRSKMVGKSFNSIIKLYSLGDMTSMSLLWSQVPLIVMKEYAA